MLLQLLFANVFMSLPVKGRQLLFLDALGAPVPSPVPGDLNLIWTRLHTCFSSALYLSIFLAFLFVFIHLLLFYIHSSCYKLFFQQLLRLLRARYLYCLVFVTMSSWDLSWNLVGCVYIFTNPPCCQGSYVYWYSSGCIWEVFRCFTYLYIWIHSFICQTFI